MTFGKSKNCRRFYGTSFHRRNLEKRMVECWADYEDFLSSLTVNATALKALAIETSAHNIVDGPDFQ